MDNSISPGKDQIIADELAVRYGARVEIAVYY